MERARKLAEFIEKYDNINFNSTNIPKVLENLKRADEDGCLKQFFMNKKPYQSAFPYFVFNDDVKAARGKDQCAIVYALNFYGAKNPGFVFRLHDVLKQLVAGSTKEVAAITVLRNAQVELQQLQISLIDFFDEELLLALDNFVKRKKTPKILLMLLFIFGGAIGAPGLAIAGLPILSPAAGFLVIYGIINLVAWFAVRPLGDEAIKKCAREVKEYCEETV